MDAFQFDCYLYCLTQHGLIYILLIFIGILALLFVLYKYTKNVRFIMTAQVFTTGTIILNFVSMKCETFNLIWLYIGFVFFGGFLIWSGKRYVSTQCKQSLHTPRFISDFQKKYNVKVKVLPSEKIKAFVYRKTIYVTVGVLQRLNTAEIEAVLAHEVYHVRNSPNKLFSSILALTSLTFKRHNDDPMADKYAASVMGKEPLINAFKKLEIIDGEERIRRLAS